MVRNDSAMLCYTEHNTSQGDLRIVCVCMCRIEEAVMKSNETGQVDLPCVQGTVIEMEEGFMGHNFTLPVNAFTFLHMLLNADVYALVIARLRTFLLSV